MTQKINRLHRNKFFPYKKLTYKLIGLIYKIRKEYRSAKFTPNKIVQQIFTYLKHTPYEIGYLINFGSTNLYIKRYILTNDHKRSVLSVKNL